MDLQFPATRSANQRPPDAPADSPDYRSAHRYGRGVVAMANRGKDTNGSQFFIVDRDTRLFADPGYTPFGAVTSGMEIVDQIAAAGSDNSTAGGDGRPRLAVNILSVTVTPL